MNEEARRLREVHLIIDKLVEKWVAEGRQGEVEFQRMIEGALIQNNVQPMFHDLLKSEAEGHRYSEMNRLGKITDDEHVNRSKKSREYYAPRIEAAGMKTMEIPLDKIEKAED